MSDLTALLVSFAVTVRQRGCETPWCVDTYEESVGGAAVLVCRIGPAMGASGGIVCAPVVMAGTLATFP